MLLDAARDQIAQFGQTPLQLFTKPHVAVSTTTCFHLTNDVCDSEELAARSSIGAFEHHVSVATADSSADCVRRPSQLEALEQLDFAHPVLVASTVRYSTAGAQSFFGSVLIVARQPWTACDSHLRVQECHLDRLCQLRHWSARTKQPVVTRCD